MEELRHFELGQLRGLGGAFLHCRDGKAECWGTDRNAGPIQGHLQLKGKASPRPPHLEQRPGTVKSRSF